MEGHTPITLTSVEKRLSSRVCWAKTEGMGPTMDQHYQPDTDKLLTSVSNGVLTIGFNRPEAMNALHPEMLTGVASLVTLASDDASICAVILQGEGRAFSAGVD